MVKVSVIVPVYKTEPYLRRCADSILAQTFTDFELILVDDGSPDNCPAICDEYAKNDNRVKVIHKPNGGVSSARNVGLDIAAGEYVTFVDSDDYIADDWLKQLYEMMYTNNYDCVSGNCSSCGDIINNGLCSKHHLVGDGHIVDAQSLSSFLINNIFSGALGWEVCFRIFKTSIIKENHLAFCEKCDNYAEDLGFVLAYTLYCRNVGFLPCAGYYYFIHPQSMMHKSKGLIKLKALNEVSKSFGNSILKSPWKGTAIEKALPVFHFLIMETEYNKMYYGMDIIHLKKEIKKIASDEWYSMQTNAFSAAQAEAMLPRAKEDIILASKISKQCNGSVWGWYSFLFWCFTGKIYRKIKLLNKKNRLVM